MSAVPPRPPKRWEAMSPRERAEAREVARRVAQQDASDRARDLNTQMLEQLAMQIRQRQTAADTARRSEAFLRAYESLCVEHNISIVYSNLDESFQLLPFDSQAIANLRRDVMRTLEVDDVSTEIEVSDSEIAPPIPPLEGGHW